MIIMDAQRFIKHNGFITNIIPKCIILNQKHTNLMILRQINVYIFFFV